MGAYSLFSSSSSSLGLRIGGEEEVVDKVISEEGGKGGEEQ